MTSRISAPEIGMMFTTPMVEALMRRHKKETRRLLSPSAIQFRLPGATRFVQPNKEQFAEAFWRAKDYQLNGDVWSWTARDRHYEARLRWRAGHKIWVREKHARIEHAGKPYLAFCTPDHPLYTLRNGAWVETEAPDPDLVPKRWAPSLLMRREYCRMTATVRAIQIQRLQDITDDSARREGATPQIGESGQIWSMDWSEVGETRRFGGDRGTDIVMPDDVGMASPRLAFADYINRVHGPNTWMENPLVVAIGFDITTP